MTRGCLLLLLLLQVMPARAGDQAYEVHLVSEIWPGYTNADGSGLGWDILRKIFEPAGLSLRLESMPYTRSIGLVQRGEADAWVGSYRNEVTGGVFYPRHAYDVDRIAALSLASTPAPSLETLGQYRVVWLRGYGFEKYLPSVRNYHELQQRSVVLEMLERGHADVFIDADYEIINAFSDIQHRERFRITDLTELPLYLGFADTPRGRRFARIYDQRMAELLTKDELRSVFERWQQPYPF